ncbi:MAG: hypothetical protein V1704_01420 [Candidatus Vogelbacteria bacterium]
MKKKKLHKMVVEVIEGSTGGQLESLAGMIKAMKILEGHDEVIQAWKGREGMLFGKKLGVTASLLKQKKEAEEMAEAKKKGIDLDELQLQTENLLALLKDRRPGMDDLEWDGRMEEQLRNLHALASLALD